MRHSHFAAFSQASPVRVSGQFGGDRPQGVPRRSQQNEVGAIPNPSMLLCCVRMYKKSICRFFVVLWACDNERETHVPPFLYEKSAEQVTQVAFVWYIASRRKQSKCPARPKWRSSSPCWCGRSPIHPASLWSPFCSFRPPSCWPGPPSDFFHVIHTPETKTNQCRAVIQSS